MEVREMNPTANYTQFHWERVRSICARLSELGSISGVNTRYCRETLTVTMTNRCGYGTLKFNLAKHMLPEIVVTIHTTTTNGTKIKIPSDMWIIEKVFWQWQKELRAQNRA